MLKGMGIGAIMHLAIGLLVASLFISAATVGSLGEAIQQGFDDLGADEDPTVEIEDKQALSDLMAYTRDRGINDGCEAVKGMNEEEGGYEGLEGTVLTSNPDCFGGEAGLARGLDGINPGGLGADDNFMAGSYSKEQFIIEENMTLRIGWLQGETPLELGYDDFEGNIDIVLEGYPSQYSDEIEHEGGGDVNWQTTAAGGGMVGSVVGPGGTAAGATAGAILGAIGATVANYIDDETDIAPVSLFFENQDVYDRTNMDPSTEGREIDVKVTLCEGDSGYVQGNRGQIDDESYNDHEPLYPIIVVQDSEHETCDDDVDLGSPLDYRGPFTGPQWYTGWGATLTGGGDTHTAHTFELRDENLEDIEESGGHNPGPDRCQLFAEYDDGQTHIREAAAYPLDTNIPTEAAAGTDPDTQLYSGIWFDAMEGEEEPEDWEHGEGGGNDGQEHLQELIPNIQLRGEVEDEFGESDFTNNDLRDRSNLKYELEAELLCANPNDENYAEWHLCHDELDTDLQHIDNWSCDTSTGEWETTPR